MTADAKLATLAQLCGILPHYKDMQGHVRVTSPETQRALLSALGIPVESDALIQQSLTSLRDQADQRRFPEEVIVDSGRAFRLEFGKGATWTLRSDGDGSDVARGDADAAISLPPLPSGYYELSMRVSDHVETARVLAAPRRLASVEDLCGKSRLWGINLALYGLQSDRNCGLGDFEDLAEVAALAGGLGAAFVGVNPIHNMGYCDPSFSPYSPSHRGFLNTEHIALDAISGLEGSPRAPEILNRESAQITLLRASKEVPYQQHKALQHRVLNAMFAVFQDEATDAPRAQFQVFERNAGPDLKEFARYEALSEIYGSDWRDWPTNGLAEPDALRVKFHMWLQWLADVQLQAGLDRDKATGLCLGLYLDLAVGPRRGGAESWCERDCIAQGVSVGAPPDHLSPQGQNWNLSAFSPRKLQQANYRPLRRILAQTMRHAGVLRIDHVLGLARSFLVPDNGAAGGYVTYPLESLIAVIKIEAERHSCAVIGEDLGLVPENFREHMRDHGFYGYSVLQYEKTQANTFKDPAKGSTQVLSCFATHDTPTVKGYEAGCDIEWWHRLGWIGDKDVSAAQRDRAKDVAALMRLAAPAPDFQSAVHAILAGSAASMVSIQLDDILGATEAQNLPGTIDQHPNWRRKYNISLENIPAFKGLSETVAIMTRARPAQKEEALHVIPYC